MKAIVCEMCGSQDLVKEDGLYICQNCGTKYSTDEAKKLMVEVAGKVKLDTSDELENLYQIARRAKNDQNNENAAKYYDLILQKDPFSWEANFYTVYFKSIDCKMIDISSTAKKVSSCIKSTLTLIAQYVTNEDERKSAVQEVYERSETISKLLFDGATQAVKLSGQTGLILQMVEAAEIEASYYDSLIEVFGDDEPVMVSVGIPHLKNALAKE